MKKLVIVFLLLLLAACSGGEDAVSTSVAQTLEARPTNTAVPTNTPEPTNTPVPTDTAVPSPTPEPTEIILPTDVPLEAVNLLALVYQDGDLPSHLTPTNHSDSELLTQNTTLSTVPDGVNFINLNFHNENSGFGGGSVIVWVYEDTDDSISTYLYLADVINENHNLLGQFGFEPSVGGAAFGGVDTPQIHLAFIRCHAAVYVWMIDATEDQIVAYAQRLDSRLNELVC